MGVVPMGHRATPVSSETLRPRGSPRLWGSRLFAAGSGRQQCLAAAVGGPPSLPAAPALTSGDQSGQKGPAGGKGHPLPVSVSGGTGPRVAVVGWGGRFSHREGAQGGGCVPSNSRSRARGRGVSGGCQLSREQEVTPRSLGKLAHGEGRGSRDAGGRCGRPPEVTSATLNFPSQGHCLRVVLLIFPPPQACPTRGQSLAPSPGLLSGRDFHIFL